MLNGVLNYRTVELIEVLKEERYKLIPIPTNETPGFITKIISTLESLLDNIMIGIAAIGDS
ncbi:hypothetical protein EHQ43_15960 [Leptospira bouyouniensis]|uniref:Uncharacterized protein n=1 Tax=Leptospira bouyouniensis TaxID=2484911 RepID=A0A7I0IJ64_9LEPT|nr:hypothetical protein [Leptospira bouyouniensis]TGL03277.1 hypothetical protein EHQ43_15960 [Leptospira bouyouniensis]